MIKNLPEDMQKLAYQRHKEDKVRCKHEDCIYEFSEFLEKSLSYLFIWENTPEKHQYWQNIADKYHHRKSNDKQNSIHYEIY